jgi:hypothetical protein
MCIPPKAGFVIGSALNVVKDWAWKPAFGKPAKIMEILAMLKAHHLFPRSILDQFNHAHQPSSSL